MIIFSINRFFFQHMNGILLCFSFLILFFTIQTVSFPAHGRDSINTLLSIYIYIYIITRSFHHIHGIGRCIHCR